MAGPIFGDIGEPPMNFSSFAVPRQYQHRVLFWGILGMIVLRAIMIGLGTTLVEKFGWVLYVFAAFLILTGIKMSKTADEDYNVGTSAALRVIKKYLPARDELHGEKFPPVMSLSITFAIPTARVGWSLSKTR
jgi:tellurite resistance protein TerC